MWVCVRVCVCVLDVYMLIFSDVCVCVSFGLFGVGSKRKGVSVCVLMRDCVLISLGVVVADNLKENESVCVCVCTCSRL